MEKTFSQKENRKRIMFITQFALLLAIEAIVAFTPLGSIPVGPVVATLAAIPVIITGIVMGTRAGALMGFVMGLFSLIVWTFMPPQPTAFVFSPFYSIGNIHGNFWSLVICFIPRILIGVVAGLSYKLFSKLRMSEKTYAIIFKNKFVNFGLSGVLSSLTNTFLVLGGMYLFFGKDLASAVNKAYNLVLGILGGLILTNGIPEAVLGAVIAMAVCPPLIKLLERSKSR